MWPLCSLSAVGPRRIRPLQLAIDRVERPALDPALNPAQVLPDECQDETLDPEHVERRDGAEERPREVRVADPEDDPPGGERGRAEGAERAERDARPLDRLRPVAGEHVQREPREPERGV